MRIAIPCNFPGGLEAEISEHFGECEIFTFIDIDPKRPIEGNLKIHLMENSNHLNCGTLLLRLKKAGIDMIIVKKIGKDALEIIKKEQVPIYSGNGTVLKIIDDFQKNQLGKLTQSNICNGKNPNLH